MRGDSFDLNLSYYIIGKHEGTYYYLTVPYNNTNINMMMVSMKFDTIGLSPIKISIKKKDNPNYYSFLGGTGFYNLATNDKNILDLSSSSTSQTFQLNSNNSFYQSADNIYPGIWYTLLNQSNLNEPLWNTQICTTNEKPFCNKQMNPQTDGLAMEIMFVPQNIKPNYLNFFKDNSCKQWEQIDIGLLWFQYWITNDEKNKTINCNSDYVSSKSQNCYFSNNVACSNGYLYQFCTPDQSCGKCLGICEINNDTMKPCSYNLTDTKNSDSNPLVCDNVTPKSDNSYLIFIIFCIFLIIIFIVIGIFLFYKVYKNKNK